MPVSISRHASCQNKFPDKRPWQERRDYFIGKGFQHYGDARRIVFLRKSDRDACHLFKTDLPERTNCRAWKRAVKCNMTKNGTIYAGMSTSGNCAIALVVTFKASP